MPVKISSQRIAIFNRKFTEADRLVRTLYLLCPPPEQLSTPNCSTKMLNSFHSAIDQMEQDLDYLVTIDSDHHSYFARMISDNDLYDKLDDLISNIKFLITQAKVIIL